MTDIIEKHFIERIENAIWVGNWIADESWKDNEPPYDKPSIFALREQVDRAKTFMKMLKKYQRLKNEI